MEHVKNFLLSLVLGVIIGLVWGALCTPLVGLSAGFFFGWGCWVGTNLSFTQKH